MLVAGFDTETTGLNTQEDHIIQAAVVLWDTDPVPSKAKRKFETFIYGPHIQKIDEAAAKVNGITLEDLQKYGVAPEYGFASILRIFQEADAIVAHNGNLFDKPIFKANCERHGVEFPEKLWIDTSCDVDYPPHINTRRLSHLASDHNFLNPFPHVALSDVLTMLRIADQYDWNQIFTWAKAPSLVIRADSTFQQKELVKKQNYRWDNDNKMWIKSIKDFQLAEAELNAKAAGFGVTVLKGPKK